MAVRVHVQNGSQIVVPLRFNRAVTGRPRLDAPDLDDRAWVANRPAGYATTGARGPLFGVTVGDTVRLKVEREDLDTTAPLFATVSDSAEPQIEVTGPAGGGPIGEDGVVHVRGVGDTSTGQTLEIRLGSATGPVLAEAEPHAFELRTLLVTPHLVAIHQAATAPTPARVPTTQADLTRIFNIARAVWRPAGIHLSVAAAVPHDVVNAPYDDRCFRQAAAGTARLDTITSLGYVPNRLNMYFVRALEGFLGLGIRREVMGDNFAAAGPAMGLANPACIIAMTTSFQTNGGGGAPVTFNDFNRGYTGAELDQALGNDVAHEIGHFLSLTHAGNVNGTGRNDSYSRRQLMQPNNLLPSGVGERRTDIGYGITNSRGHRGCLITVKNHPQQPEDGEVKKARDRMLHANLY